MLVRVTPSASERYEIVQLIPSTHQQAVAAPQTRMKIRLTHKFAELINGVDLSKAHEGETLDLSQRDAEILLAEGWAEYEGGAQPRDKAHEAQRIRKARRRSRKKR